MIRNILNKLENPERPLLGPNVKALEFWGLLLPKNTFKRYFYLFMHLCVTIFTATECVDIWFVKTDLTLLLNNLKITMLASVSVCKVTTFLYWQEHWKSIIEYVTEADKACRTTDDIINKKIINTYTKYCRKITYWYWSLMYTTVIIVTFQPVFKYFYSPTYRENVKNGTEVYMQVVSSWVPFNKNEMPQYLFASALQTYASVYGGGWITSFDTNAMGIMVFIRGELELLRRDCGKIFGSTGFLIDEGAPMKKLIQCQRRHRELVKYANLFDSCLSPIMLFYMLVCSIMLCVTAYQITIETNPMQRFLLTEYLVFGIIQLFVYCWHSNDVLYASQELCIGPYESDWVNVVSQRQELHILIEQFKKVIVFSAGPFTKLTVPTFINILKGAYSYYTLLSSQS